MIMKVLTSPDYEESIKKDITKNISLEEAISKSLKDIKQRDVNYLKVYKILSNKEKEKFNFVQFVIPACTSPPSLGVIDTNVPQNSWIIKRILELPEAITKKTLEYKFWLVK